MKKSGAKVCQGYSILLMNKAQSESALSNGGGLYAKRKDHPYR